MRATFWLLASVVFGALLAPAHAAVDEKYKSGWKAAFDYVESSFLYGVAYDTVISIVPTKVVPFVGQADKLLARWANTMAVRLKPLGIDSSKYITTSVDGVQLARIAFALEWGERGRLPARLRGELLAYALCPWQVPQCTDEVKAAIWKARGWGV